MKTITFLNKKGGVGKTSLAFSVAKELDYFLISNDDSVIESIYPDKAKIMEKVKYIDNADIVYDLGGFVDKNAIEVIKNSNIVFIPTLLDINSVKRTINTVAEIKDFNEEIVLIVNNYTANDMKKYHTAIDKLKQIGLDIIFIQKSEAIPNSLYMGKTIVEQYNQSNLNKNSFKRIYEAFNSILRRIDNV